MKNLKATLYKPILFIALSLGIISTGVSAASAQTARGKQILNLETKLVQNKVLMGSDGLVSMELTLSAQKLPDLPPTEQHPVDLIVVLDRSGSMEGQKIDDARYAIGRLLDRLSGRDRFALISYANNVYTHTPLVEMSLPNVQRLRREVARIQASGGTNLGGGLQRGVNMFTSSAGINRQRKVILISDGLANQGITDPYQLGNIASNGPEHNFSVSTVGVGYDFNEVLMTTIADHGGGNYSFLESPERFAEVFEKECRTARSVAASGTEIRIALPRGVTLVDGGGYPIKMENRNAVIRPGDILSGQQRNFFLTFAVPTSKKQHFSLGSITACYRNQGTEQRVQQQTIHSVACVDNENEVLASIDKQAWSRQTVNDAYNKMKEKVASAVKSGKKAEALASISEYEAKTRKLNATLDSAEVAENLDGDVSMLKQQVQDTFTGAPAAVMQKQKAQSKALQYESYKGRRDKQ